MAKVKMFALLALALVASVSASVYVDSKCPEVKAVENFDLAAYAKGKWYEAARYSNRAEVGTTCPDAQYSLDGDTFKVKNSGVMDKKTLFIEGVGRPAVDAGTGKIRFTLPYGISGKGTEHVFNILSIDYDNYLIGYHCKYDEERKSRQDFSWIFSRTKTMSPEVKTKIDKFIKESKVLDGTKYEWQDFSDEACYTEA